MKRMRIITKLGICLFGMFLLTETFAQDEAKASESDAVTENSEVKKPALTGIDAESGRKYFEGSSPFLNGGPACISCHNVNHSNVMPGGVLAKDLSDVYERMGEGISAWLTAPPFPAMISSYQNHELTEQERLALTAFLKEASEQKASPKSATSYFLYGGIGGFAIILIIINILWFKRKRHMVKKDIFLRQSKAWDAKH